MAPQPVIFESRNPCPKRGNELIGEGPMLSVCAVWSSIDCLGHGLTGLVSARFAVIMQGS